MKQKRRGRDEIKNKVKRHMDQKKKKKTREHRYKPTCSNLHVNKFENR